MGEHKRRAGRPIRYARTRGCEHHLGPACVFSTQPAVVQAADRVLIEIEYPDGTPVRTCPPDPAPYASLTVPSEREAHRVATHLTSPPEPGISLTVLTTLTTGGRWVVAPVSVRFGGNGVPIFRLFSLEDRDQLLSLLEIEPPVH